MIFVAVAALLLVLVWDLRSYSLLKPEQPMATLGFQAEGPQRYRVLIQGGADERSVVLDGELQQLGARIPRWKGLVVLIGLVPGCRFNALSGRFLVLERQPRGRRLGLSQNLLGVDLWRWLRAGEHGLFLPELLAGRVTSLLMADKVVLVVNYGVVGLLTEPMNLATEEALRNWR